MNQTCSICFDPINYDKKKLKCDHIFHQKCIKKWYSKNVNLDDNLDCYLCGSCPICRSKSEEMFLSEFKVYNTKNTSINLKLYIITKRLFIGVINKLVSR